MISFPFKIVPSFLNNNNHPITIPKHLHGDLEKEGLAKKHQEVSIICLNRAKVSGYIYSSSAGYGFYYQIGFHPSRNNPVESLKISDQIQVDITKDGLDINVVLKNKSEHVEIKKLYTEKTSIEHVREATIPQGTIVHVEDKELPDGEFDQAINENRLRIGMVETNTEMAIARQRRGQARIRELTLLKYSSKCALCDVNDPSLLVASHIVGWAELPEARGILSNIICLCRFHDVLFEHGYLSLADDLAVLKKNDIESHTVTLLLDNAMQFRRPYEHLPDPRFLQWHRNRSGL
jgi:predicted restriction endonuclease